MLRLNLFIISLFLSIFTLNAFAELNAYVENVPLEKPPIVTPSPESTMCTTIAAHWEGNIWIDTQSMCEYKGRTEGVAWLQHYWTCPAYTGDGNCKEWVYKPGHWVNTVS